jgi:hypothetical protein
LTVSVLDETKMVDGVTTRVVEEREEKRRLLKTVLLQLRQESLDVL